MEGRQVFLVGNGDDASNSAKNLGKLFYPNSAPEVANLSYVNYFGALSETDLEHMVFLGHGNPSQYGGYSAKKFAQRISEQFQYKEEKKQFVKDLYLIGCDMGLINKSGQSLAQEIANELYNNGFKNVRIHSVAQPEDAVGEALYVEVIEGMSGAQLIRNKTNQEFDIPTIKPGFISAYLFNQKDGDEFFELLKNKKKNVAKLDKLKKERAFVFVHEANPAVELDKPHNIFLPHEKPELRMQRIAEHPNTVLSEKQSEAITYLKLRREYEDSKKNKTLARKLDFIITQVSRAQPQDWQNLLKKFKPYLEKTLPLLGVKLDVISKSNTLKLLTHLSNDDFEKAKKIIENQKSSKQKNQVTKSTSMLFHKKSEKSPVSKHPFNREENASSETKETLHEMLQFQSAKGQIQAAIRIYEGKIEELSCCCFSLFNLYEINTKIKKKEALASLIGNNIKSFKAMQLRAGELMLDERVMLSWNTTVTKDLLNAIVNGSENLMQGAEPLNVNTREDDYSRSII